MVLKPHILVRYRISLLWVLGSVAFSIITQPILACSFCIAESQTLSEEFETSSVILMANMTEAAPAAEAVRDSGVPYGFVDPSTGAAKFKVLEIFKGKEHLEDREEIEAIYFGEPDEETVYLIRGLGVPPEWNLPLPLSPIAVDYVPKLFDLPKSGGDRLAFFQDYLEHEDLLLSQDAYDEFARAPNSDLYELGDRMNREQLVEWIESPSVSPSRRRLFLVMLGVCGNAPDRNRVEAMILSDIRLLEASAELGTAACLGLSGPWGIMILPEMTRMHERQRKLGLDAMIACYLLLSSKEGIAEESLAEIEDRFLKDDTVEYTHVYASLQALRFLGDEQTDLVPIDRVIQSARLLLESDEFADQVIPDLARWEDWETLPRLYEMFKLSLITDKYQYVREPIVTYLDVAAEQQGDVGEQAKEALEWIENASPESVSRARRMAAFGFLAKARRSETPPAMLNDNATESSEDPSSIAENTLTEETTESEADRNTNPTLVSQDAKQFEDFIEPSNPPSRFLLILAPLAVAGICYGLFWWILKGGASR